MKPIIKKVLHILWKAIYKLLDFLVVEISNLILQGDNLDDLLTKLDKLVRTKIDRW